MKRAGATWCHVTLGLATALQGLTACGGGASVVGATARSAPPAWEADPPPDKKATADWIASVPVPGGRGMPGEYAVHFDDLCVLKVHYKWQSSGEVHDRAVTLKDGATACIEIPSPGEGYALGVGGSDGSKAALFSADRSDCTALASAIGHLIKLCSPLREPN